MGLLKKKKHKKKSVVIPNDNTQFCKTQLNKLQPGTIDFCKPQIITGKTGINGAVDFDNTNTDYPYYKYIKDNASIGITSKGTLAALGKDINGLKEYVGLLVSGDSKASTTGKPLGNKYFYKTNGKCLDTNTKETVDRYIYINNVPSGNIPLVSSGADMKFSNYKGLIPGAISNLNTLNPNSIFQAFSTGANPECQRITMETIDIRNNRSTETQFVTLTDIINTDPCSFQNKKNPITNEKCKEKFTNISNHNFLENEYDEYEYDEIMSNENIFTIDNSMYHMYLGSLGVIGVYILYRLMIKYKLI